MMNKLYITILFISIFAVKAFALPIDSCVTAILNKNKAQLDTAVKTLVAKNDPASYAFVSAILDKRLYRLGAKAVTVYPGDSVVYEVYPQQQVAQTSTGELTELVLSRKVRTYLNKLAKYVNLTHIKPEHRSTSYQAFRSTGTLADVDYLSTFLQKEKDPKVKEIGKLVIFSIWLKSDNANLQAQALDSLSHHVSDDLQSSLEQYIASFPENSTDPKLSQAQEIVSSINSRQRLINTLQNLFSGLSLGSILLLVSLGLAIIYGLGGVINMSHGEFMMIGAYTTYTVQQFFIAALPPDWFGAFFWFSLPLSFVVAGLFGLLIEQLIIRHLYNRPLESLLATWGISLILIQASRSIFGDVTAVKAPDILSGGLEVMNGFILPYNRLFIIGLTVVMVVLTYLAFFRSRLGLKIRAVTQNRNMSASLGISTKRIDSATFFLGSGLAGTAGCAMTLIGNVVPNMGQTYIVDSFLVVVVGGVGKLLGTIISALGIGVFSKAFEFFFEAVYGKVIMLGIIVFFLQYKSKGLFPDKGRLSDD